MSRPFRPIGKGSKYELAIVTGGSSGIGQSLIDALWKIDPNLDLINLSRRRPEAFSAFGQFEHISCDLSDRDDRAVAFARLAESVAQRSSSGPIALFNNAGFGLYGDADEQAVRDHLELLEVNLCALVDLSLRLLPLLKQRGGIIVNIASTAAFQPTPHFATYGASKAFVLNWTLALAEELRDSPAESLAACPGPTRTEFFRRAGFAKHAVPRGFSQGSSEVARAIVSAALNGRSLLVPGLMNKLLATLSSLLPIRARTALAGKAIGRYRSKARTTE